MSEKNKKTSKKYEFLSQPPHGTYGKWVTKEGWTYYTDNRTTAVRWYARDLKYKKL